MSEDAPKANQPPFVPPVSTFTGPVGELIAQRMLAPPPRPGLLAILDHYEILRLLGGGGMGMVLLARDAANGREVAVKLVKSDLVTNQHAVHRFLKETGHLKRLRHTNIVPVEEISDRPEGPYFVMPYFEKGSLANRIKPGQPLSTESVLDIAIPVAEGLSFAHRSGIIHRDLKPANILLGNVGQVCLADFGLARSMFNDTIVDVETRQLEGTAPYMSPAIAAGDAEDTRCDIYSFGALLYEMLTGWPPYQGRGTKEILDQILAGPPKPIISLNAAANHGLITVAEGCMARELRDRYADMRDVLNDLRRVQEGKEPVAVRKDKQTPRAPRALVIAACVLGIALLASGAWMVSHSSRSTPASNPVVALPTSAIPVLPIVKTPLPTVEPSTNPLSVTNVVAAPPPQIVIATNTNAGPVTNIASLPPQTIPLTNPVISNVPVVIPVAVPAVEVRKIVSDIVQLSTNGLGDAVIVNFAKAHLPDPPLTTAELGYLKGQGVSPAIIDIFRQDNSFPTKQPSIVPAGDDLHTLLKAADDSYRARLYPEAIDYCSRALKLDPQNVDAICVKAASEDFSHNTAEAITGFVNFLKLPAAQNPKYSEWRTYAKTRLKALRGW